MSRAGRFWNEMEGRTPPPPAARLLGRRVIQVDPEAGMITVEFRASEDFLNSMGTIQGGFLAAMLDSTLGLALRAGLEPRRFAPTLELKVSFIQSAKVGVLVGRGRVLHRGTSTAFLEGDLRNADGQLVATATATARIVTSR